MLMQIYAYKNILFFMLFDVFGLLLALIDATWLWIWWADPLRNVGKGWCYKSKLGIYYSAIWLFKKRHISKIAEYNLTINMDGVFDKAAR